MQSRSRRSGCSQTPPFRREIQASRNAAPLACKTCKRYTLCQDAQGIAHKSSRDDLCYCCCYCHPRHSIIILLAGMPDEGTGLGGYHSSSHHMTPAPSSHVLSMRASIFLWEPSSFTSPLSHTHSPIAHLSPSILNAR